MKNTEEKPMDAKVAGTVVVVHGGHISSAGMNKVKWWLSDRYNFTVSDVMYIDQSTTDILGLYLDRALYSPSNKSKVDQALWVLSDVLGNVELEDWSTEMTKPTYIEDVGKFRLHTGNQHYMDVALRVLVVELV